MDTRHLAPIISALGAQANAEVSRLGTTSASLKLKGIDGGPHKQRSVWFNSTQRAEPYPDWTCHCKRLKGRRLRGCGTDAAWLSSARVVRCWVKSRNERNPYGQLPSVWPDCPFREEGGDDVKSAWLLHLGRHTRYNGADSAQPRSNPAQIAKRRLSADWGLQLAPMKAELLVTAYQPWRGEYVPGPCTHRPSRHGSGQCLKSVGQPQGGSGRGQGPRLGRSRNKVAVPEGAAGSPPF
jgi:hypothetical protein